MKKLNTDISKFSKILTESSNRSHGGLSINNRARLVFTVGLQNELELNPTERTSEFYVEIRAVAKPKSLQEKYQFYIGFYKKTDNHAEATQKFYKPNIRARNNYTSYIELGKHLKATGIVNQVKELKDKLNPGPVEIISKSSRGDPLNYIIISLYDNFSKPVKKKSK